MDHGCRRPTAEEVISRLKDDGDFDSLRLKIIRKVKENEELRNRIVSEVKQSVVLNEDDSEKMKLRELSDAIYQELGSKIMGQISDEVWKIIRSSENDIRGTVEAVYDRIVNPKEKKQDTSSPHKAPQSDGKKGHDSLVTPSTSEINVSDTNEQMEAPPGFDSTDWPISKVKSEPVLQGKQPQPSNKDPNQAEQVDSLPPGFGPVAKSPIRPIVVADEDPDVPPGFG
ncbi:uncharacterized protein LOC121991829 [Zingiber officinale]|uniref:uncharacterized protein LOC121991829 n=1 Tax=Zingiber officinale TaxID=94328 RepID=UPI001C4C6A6C|nr:uncharacterized protein LOC121991829 [Zingiber officinale]